MLLALGSREGCPPALRADLAQAPQAGTLDIGQARVLTVSEEPPPGGQDSGREAGGAGAHFCSLSCCRGSRQQDARPRP